MTNKIKIVVAGIGGVGGYFGGRLAQKYRNSNDIEIYFLARGEHLKKIKEIGLQLIKGDSSFVAHPKLASNNAYEIGVADFIIVCTKTYDLEAALWQLKPCINNYTIILPLLNGVDSAEIVKSILPNNIVAKGCVYIVSRLKESGIVENSGNIESLFFGLDGETNDKLAWLENAMKDAGIEATLTKNIASIIWEKFIFISPTATATSYYNTCIGKLIEEHEETVIKLINEIKDLAILKGIAVDNDIVSKTINKLKSLPYETTSSMHSDFKNKKSNTELEALTAYVIKQGIQLKYNTPTYEFIYRALKSRN